MQKASADRAAHRKGPSMDDKVIVSNRRALRAKYGTRGLARIRAAVAALIRADKKRGIVTRLVFVDDARAMKALKASPVADDRSPREHKTALDGIYKRLAPDYLLILGAPDVVPHQDLANPVFKPDDDDDRIAWSDLPYACDAPYATDIAAFVGPTRVVGRLPDLTGAHDPAHLVTLLRFAAAHVSRVPADYAGYFGLSTASWQKSTAQSLDNVFGNATGLRIAPPAKPPYGAGALGALMHFVNCHGGLADPSWYGEKGRKTPVAMTSSATAGKIREATVAAIECCYGADLYDAVTLALPLPICQRYLAQGACGYFGSTTIAYGPAEGNGCADLVTQYFLLSLQEGASTGRAALTARQRYVQQAGQMDPIDLKTLAQFCLLGDPAVQPIRVPSPTVVPKSMPATDAWRLMRRERRAKLRATGEFLGRSMATASRREPKAAKSSQIRAALAQISRRAGLPGAETFTAYAVRGGGASKTRAKGAGVTTRYYVGLASAPHDKTSPARHGYAVVAKEQDGRIVGYRVYAQR